MGLRARLSLVIAGMSVLVAAVLGLLVHARTAAVTLDVARRALDAELTSALPRHQEGQDTPLGTGPLPAPLAEALRTRLEAERRVTADIAHELRTPVAGLVTAAELLPPGRPAELVKSSVTARGRWRPGWTSEVFESLLKASLRCGRSPSSVRSR